MIWEYDKENDIGYVVFGSQRMPAAKSVEVDVFTRVDYDDAGNVIGIEFDEPKEGVEIKDIPDVNLDELRAFLQMKKIEVLD